MNAHQQEAFLSTFEQAGAAIVRRAIANDHWPREVHELAQDWLATRDEAERPVMAANALAADAQAHARDANAIAKAASVSADRSASRARITNVVAAASAAVATAALIAASWPR